MTQATYRPTDRRPMQARQWSLPQQISTWLVRAGATPNGISLAGLLAGLAGGGLLAATTLSPDWARACWLLGAALVLLRLLCNLFDGMVAVESGRASPVGELYNEVPDRISDSVALIGLGYGAGNLSLGLLAACLAVFTAYVRAMGKAAGARHEYCGPMAKPQRMAIVIGVALFYGLAPASWQLAANGAFPGSLAAVGLVAVSIGCVITSLRRLVRIAAQLRSDQP